MTFKLSVELFYMKTKYRNETGRKTLTIALSAYLNALEEKGVHIVTVNDYLQKETQEMGQIYNFLGLTSGFINNYQDDYERKKQW